MKGFLERLEKSTLFLWLLLLPTQLGKHFWPEWSTVMGVRIDYNSPTLYLVDLVWTGWVITKIFNSKLKISNQFKILNFENITIIGLVVLNVLVAGNKWLAVYRWLRLAQLGVSFWILKRDKIKVLKYLVWIVPVWIVTESLLGLAQMTKGGSLEGLWWFLGERRFRVGSIAVAQFSVLGREVLRAYGTFSHPNSLAGFLLLSLVAWRWLKSKVKSRTLWWIVSWLAVLGVVISGSRTAWVMLLIVVIMSYGAARISFKKIIGVTILTAGVFLLILGLVGVNYRTTDFIGGWDSDSLGKRIGLNQAAVKMWKDNFLWGVGLGNFINELPEYQAGSRFYWLQPAHNIFLLWATETGMLGIAAAVWLTQIIWNNEKSKWKWLVLLVLVVTGTVDHYSLTLPQNMWLATILLAVM